MAFLHMFDLMDFDAEGNVCASKMVTREQAQANYLYLISKYNQIFLRERGLEVPQFFKEDLSAVMAGVENGEDFAKAKSKVLDNCGNFVQSLSTKSSSDQELVEMLNENVVIKDAKFYQEYNKAVNDLQRSYIITRSSGNIFSDIVMDIAKGVSDKKTKSELFKNIIKYNNRVLLAEKVHSVNDAQEARVYA